MTVPLQGPGWQSCPAPKGSLFPGPGTGPRNRSGGLGRELCLLLFCFQLKYVDTGCMSVKNNWDLNKTVFINAQGSIQTAKENTF